METVTASVSYPFSTPLPLVLTILLAGAFLLYHSSATRRRGPNLPHGSKWHWPFAGETLRMISAYRSDDPERFTDDLIRRNGRIFTTHLFGEPVLFSADPEFNQFILNNEFRYFSLDYFSTLRPLLGHKALINLNGPLHQRMYTFTNTRIGSLSVLQNLLPEIDRLVCDSMDSWQDGQKVVVINTARKLSFDISLKQLTSMNPSKWTEVLRSEFTHVISGLVSIPLPSCIAFSFTRFGKAVQSRTKMAEGLRWVVRKRKERKETMGNDVLDDLLMMEDGILDEEGIVDSLASLLLGAYENPAKLLMLTVKYLTEKPHVLSHLREEHEQIMRGKKNRDDPLEWKDYEAMSFTQCVINETLRTANIVTSTHRRATTEINYKGLTIPKGFKVCPWARAVHLDPENYENARTFDPWRWQTISSSKKSSTFTPFGGGPRLCPGYKLGHLQISVFLHYFVTRLDWSVADQKDRAVFFPIVGTTKGYPIFVRRRSLQQAGCD